MSQQSGGLLCPACRVDLVMSERSGVEIDYCPRCRGVWLDRGELDKILERNASEIGAARQAAPPPPPPPPQSAHMPPPPPAHDPRYRPHDSDEYPAYGHPHHGRPYKKRKSFLNDIFDFD